MQICCWRTMHCLIWWHLLTNKNPNVKQRKPNADDHTMFDEVLSSKIGWSLSLLRCWWKVDVGNHWKPSLIWCCWRVDVRDLWNLSLLWCCFVEIGWNPNTESFERHCMFCCIDELSSVKEAVHPVPIVALFDLLFDHWLVCKSVRDLVYLLDCSLVAKERSPVAPQTWKEPSWQFNPLLSMLNKYFKMQSVLLV